MGGRKERSSSYPPAPPHYSTHSFFPLVFSLQPYPLPVWAGPCQGLCLSPWFDIPLIMVRWGGEYRSLHVSLHLLPPAHPFPCQIVMLWQNGENQLNVSSVCTSDFSSIDGCIHSVVCFACEGRGVQRTTRRGGGGGLLTDSSWGRLSPARHFTRQPADMTANAG